MTHLGTASVEDVAAACNAGAAEIGEALSRLIGATTEVSVGEAVEITPAAPPDELQGPGLMVMLTLEGSAALVAFPEASGLLPAWYGEPDATGKSVLTTLAQELGMLVLPEEFMPEGFQAARVSHLAEAIQRGGVAAGSQLLALTLKSPSGKQAVVSLIWPANSPDAVYEPAAAPASEAAASPAEQQAEPSSPPQPAVAAPKAARRPGVRATSADSATIENLPAYSRSLLRIKVPVIVTLAETKQPIGRIVELGPGTIIQFDKSCEEMLSLQVGGQPVAEGEAVKVGDKFGIRLTSLKLPGERFVPVRTHA
jgi:flagellar motor switch/type III secretory pathway protein FliN